MARIFNLYITHDGAVYNGMVSVRKTPFFTEYALSFEDNILLQLPSNKLLSPSPGRFIFQHATSHEITPVMKEVIRAVSEYVHATQD